MPIDINSSIQTVNLPAMPCLAKVISHIDSTYMGSLLVQLLKPVGDEDSSTQTIPVRMMSPYLGSTSLDYTTEDNDYNNTQKAYGWWAVPPDPGQIVVVIFINGQPDQGYWIGCVGDRYMNFSLPGLAATEKVVKTTTKGDSKGRTTRVPVAEFNKKSPANASDDEPTLFAKPAHLFTTILEQQGLLLDDVRGITTSSARREFPSAVVGISTPGPIDKNGPTGAIGPLDEQVANAPVSRLGGTTFVMDDGDDTNLRKTPANEGPPDYASVDAEDYSGDVKIPHNELVRIRTRTGHQILLHNSEDLIYIGNAKGTTWIELTSDGKVDIFAKDSVSVHTNTDINFYADRDINLEAGRNINIKSQDRTQLESIGNLNVMVTGDYKVKVVGDYINILKDFNVTTTQSVNLTSKNTNLKSSNNILLTATTIGENGPRAATALSTPPVALPTFDNVYLDKGEPPITSIMKRIPNVEPWPQHENLDPLAVTSAKTDREDTTPITFSDGSTNVPEYFKQYTTITDPFTQRNVKNRKDGANNA